MFQHECFLCSLLKCEWFSDLLFQDQEQSWGTLAAASVERMGILLGIISHSGLSK